jgi:hypothetical protein
MRFPTLLLRVLTTTVAISTVAFCYGTFSRIQAEIVSPPKMVATTTFSPAKVLASGNFVNSEHSTTGRAEVFTQNGKNYLRLDKAFKSEAGPDLFVLLHRQNSPKSYQKSDYVSLGRLEKIQGTQLYKIPTGVDITEFKSVVIWCKKFNATFGFAAIK